MALSSQSPGQSRSKLAKSVKSKSLRMSLMSLRMSYISLRISSILLDFAKNSLTLPKFALCNGIKFTLKSKSTRSELAEWRSTRSELAQIR